MSGGVSKRTISSKIWADWGGGSKKQGLVSLIGRPTYMMNYLRRRTVRIVAVTAADETKQPWEEFFRGYFDSGTKVLQGPIDNAALASAPSTDVKIPSTIDGVNVEVIGNRLFNNNTAITGVTIPNTVQRIDTGSAHGGFYGCTSMTSLTFVGGSNMTVIGYDAFNGCSALLSVAIPDSVTEIEGAAFHDCTSMSVILFGNGVVTIGNGAFTNCTILTFITFPGSVDDIGSNAFSDCTLLSKVHFLDSTPPTTLGPLIFDSTLVTKIYVGVLVPPGDAATFYNALVARPGGIPSSWPTDPIKYIDGPP